MQTTESLLAVDFAAPRFLPFIANGVELKIKQSDSRATDIFIRTRANYQ